MSQAAELINRLLFVSLMTIFGSRSDIGHFAKRACRIDWGEDKWGLSWQITPRVLMEALAVGGDAARRAFTAMMDMRKIDVAAIEAARRG